MTVLELQNRWLWLSPGAREIVLSERSQLLAKDIRLTTHTVVRERRRRCTGPVICRCCVEGGDGNVLVVGSALLGAGGPIPIAVAVREMGKPSSLLLLLVVLKMIEFAGESLLATEAPCTDSGGAIVSPPSIPIMCEYSVPPIIVVAPTVAVVIRLILSSVSLLGW